MAKISPHSSVPPVEEKHKENLSISRRSFLNTAGAATVGGLAVAVGGSLFSGKEAQAQEAPAAPSLPWKYTKLDPLEAGKRGNPPFCFYR